MSKGILKLNGLDCFLAPEKERYNSSKVEAVAGWGHKETAKEAMLYAKEKHLPYIALEDGFIRSFDLGVNNAPTMSLSVDPFGCYYDASTPSLIDHLIENKDDWFTQDQYLYAQQLIDQITTLEISKYNKSIPATHDLIFNGQDEAFTALRRKILIIDQTLNDASLILGAAPDNVEELIIQELKQNFKGSDVYIKVHPDVLAGKKKSLISLNKLRENGIRFNILAHPFNAISLLKLFDVVFTATSQMGFEALLLKKEVHCFGVPFYAGYGLTIDHIQHHRCEERKKMGLVTIEELFTVAYLKLCRYINPITNQRCSLEEVINLLALQKKIYYKNNRNFVILNASSWKKELLKNYLSGYQKLLYAKTPEQALLLCKKYHATLVQWASKSVPNLAHTAQEKGFHTLFVEDGFIRSKGLGVNYSKPFSLVFDRQGIYYDPNHNSDLEDILGTLHEREDLESLRQRAKSLIEYLTKNRITKYNVGKSMDLSKLEEKYRSLAKGKEIILVPGQVETDASVRTGGGKFKNNLDFLKAVRQDFPNSFIIYKPHPDVVSLARHGNKNISEFKRNCNLIVSKVDIALMYEIADRICVLTSQSGFEALLREKELHVYGKPFYAGWRLSTDLETFERRFDTLTLEDLVAGVLILYPRYYDWCTGLFARVEDIVYRLEHLDQAKMPQDKLLVKFLRFMLILKQKIYKHQY